MEVVNKIKIIFKIMHLLFSVTMYNTLRDLKIKIQNVLPHEIRIIFIGLAMYIQCN